MHVARDGEGRRRVSEIAILRRTARQVEVSTVWHADRGPTDEIAELRRLLQNRTVT